MYCCGGAEEPKGGVADAAAALPHALAPVGARSACCCGGERSVYCRGGAEESKRGDREKEKGGDVNAALPHAAVPVGAPGVYSCSGAEERKGIRRRRGSYVCARDGARGSAKRGGSGSLRRLARLQPIVLLRGAAPVP
jgi:hypothetical protein